ncbi:MAG: hypothetical protein L0219_11705 [Phycisphaerales bacterium]|nr:hypothetical protein [Phycisphaerales bacterium]
MNVRDGIRTNSQVTGGNLQVSIGLGNLVLTNRDAINLRGENSVGGNFSLLVQQSALSSGGFVGNGGLVLISDSPLVNSHVTVSTGSFGGDAGNIVINIHKGNLGNFNVPPPGSATLDASSERGVSGDITLAVQGSLHVDWQLDADGYRGGSIVTEARRFLTIQGDISAVGTLGEGGNIIARAGGTLTFNGNLNVSGGQAGPGGQVVAQSFLDAVNIGGSINASGFARGGDLVILGRNGASVGASIDVRALSTFAIGDGGLTWLISFNPGASLTVGGQILASGQAHGGSVVVSSAGRASFNGAIDVSGDGPLGAGGSVYISTGSRRPLTLASIDIAGGTLPGSRQGYQVVMAAGDVIDGPITYTAFTTSSNIGIFPNIRANNIYTGSGVFRESVLNANAAYEFVVLPSEQPYIRDVSANVTYGMAAGGLVDFEAISMQQLTFVTADPGFIAPLVTPRNVTVSSASPTSPPLSGNGSSPIAVLTAGNLNVAGIVDNKSSTGSAAPIFLFSGNTMTLGAGIDGRTTGPVDSSGSRVELISGAITVNGSINLSGESLYNNGGSVRALAMSANLTTGSIFANATDNNVGGSVSLAAPLGMITVEAISNTAEAGAGGRVRLSAQVVNVSGLLAGGTTSINSSAREGQAGHAVIRANDLTVAGDINMTGGTSGGTILVSLAGGSMTVGDVFMIGRGRTLGQPNHGGIFRINSSGQAQTLTIGHVDATGMGNATGGSMIVGAAGKIFLSSVNARAEENDAGVVSLRAADIVIDGTVRTGANTTAAIDASSDGGRGGFIFVTAFGDGLTIDGDIVGYANGAGKFGAFAMVSASGEQYSIGNVNLNGYSGASGGLFLGGNEIAGVTVGRASADVRGVVGLSAGGESDGGRVFLSANTAVRSLSGVALNINTSGLAGSGGDVAIAVQTSDVDGVALELGSVSTSGASGGSFVAIGVDPTVVRGLPRDPGSFNVGSINTTATGATGIGGAVAISAPGLINLGFVPVSVPISEHPVITYNSSAAPDSLKAAGGDVFISSFLGINIHGPAGQSAPEYPLSKNTGTNPGAVILYSNANVVAGVLDYDLAGQPLVSNPEGHILVKYDVGVTTSQLTQSLTGNQVFAVSLNDISSNLIPGGLGSLDLGTSSITVDTGDHPLILVPIVALSGVVTAGDVIGAQSLSNGSSVVLAGNEGVHVFGNILTGANTLDGQAGRVLLMSVPASIEIEGYINEQANTSGFTASPNSIGGKLDVITINDVIRVAGANGGISIDTSAAVEGGAVTMAAGRGMTIAGAIVTSATGIASGEGESGTVTLINAVGRIFVGENPGGISIDTHSAAGEAGDINILAGQTSNGGLQVEGNIDMFSSATDNGAVMNILLAQGDVLASNDLQIDATTSGSQPTDRGGTVNVLAPGVTLLELNWTINVSGPSAGTINIITGGNYINRNLGGFQANATDPAGTAATVIISTNSPDPFVIGQTLGTNFIAGKIVLSGPNGGTLLLANQTGALLIPDFANAIEIRIDDPTVPVPTVGNGGHLTLIGDTVQVDGITGNLIDMNGKGTGSGGSITVITFNAVTPLVIGEQRGTNYLNGNLSAVSGTDVYTDTLTSELFAGDGGSIHINAAGGVQMSASALDVDGGRHGGSITIITNTPHPLEIDSVRLTPIENGVYGGILSATGGNLLSYGNGGTIRLINQSGHVDVQQAGNLDVSVTAGNGNGGNIYLQGTGVGIHGNLQADAASAGSGNGGSVVAIATREAIIAGQLNLPGSFVEGLISAIGTGTGSGGLITLVSGSPAEQMHIAIDLFANPGAAAGAGARGGRINLFTAADSLTNAATLQTNGLGGSALAGGGDVTIARFGTQTVVALNADGLVVANNGADSNRIVNILDVTGAAGFNVTNTGTVRAFGAPGSGSINFFSNGGTLFVNDSVNVVGTLETSGVITFEAGAGTANIYANRLVGALSGVAQAVTALSATTGYGALNLVSTITAVDLTMHGDFTIFAGTRSSLPLIRDSIRTGGIQARTNLFVTTTAATDFLMTNNAVVEALGDGQPFGLVRIVNPRFGITATGGEIFGAVTTPTGTVNASSFLNVSTNSGNLQVFDNRALFNFTPAYALGQPLNGTISFTAFGGDLEFYDSGQITASRDIDFRGLTGIGSASILPGAAPNNLQISAGEALPAGVDMMEVLPDSFVDFLANLGMEGGVHFRNASGNTVLGTGNAITSRGEPITFRSGVSLLIGGGDAANGNVAIGPGNTIWAQGGNVWINATRGVDIEAGTTVMAVAQYRPSNYAVPQITIDGQPVRNFRGGNLGIIVGQDANQDLRDLLTQNQLDRKAAGINFMQNINLDENMIGGQASIFDPIYKATGGSILMSATGLGKVLINGTSFFADGGTIYIDPPGGGIGVNNANLVAIAPPLQLIVTPPTGGCVGNCGGGPPPDDPRVIPPIVNPPPRTPVAETTTKKDQQSYQQPILAPQTTVCEPVAMDSGEQQPEAGRRAREDGTTPDASSWLVAGGSCQPFSFERDDGTVVIGSGGTTFAPTKNRTLLLKEGRLMTIAGTQGIVVETAHGNVKVANETATIIEQKPSGVVRVANLAGGRADVAVVRDGDTKLITANPGEEIVIADQALGDEELIPVDGVDREPISGAIAVAGTKVKKNLFDRRMMANRENLLLCNTGCFTISMRKRFDQIKQDMDKSGPLISGPLTPSMKARMDASGNRLRAQVSLGTRAARPRLNAAAIGSDASGIDKSDLRPIGFVQPVASVGRPGSDLFTLRTDSAHIKHVGHARITLDQPGVVTLRHGETLVDSNKPTVINAGDYKIAIDAGTIALVNREGSVTKVRNLYERSSRAIQVYIGGRIVHLSVGQEMLIGPDDGSVTKALKAEQIGRRHIRSIDIPGGHTITRCEVSLVSLMNLTEILSHMLNSKHSSDQAIAGKLMKMAAVLTQVQAGHGAYSPVGQ